MTQLARILPLAVLAAVACSPAVPVPPQTERRSDLPRTVPYPPPPARVEEIGPPPNERARWVDGWWQFDGGEYRWIPGGWLEPPPGKIYAPPLLVRRANGELSYYPARWLDRADVERAKEPSPSHRTP